MRSKLLLIVAVLTLAGCMSIGRSCRGTYKLCLVNRSNEVLQNVIIKDANEKFVQFGNSAPGSENVIDDCTVDLKKLFGILFYVNGQRETNFVSLSMYMPVKNRIKTLCICYVGGNQWVAGALDAAGQEVKPSYTPAHK
jgi:hypothetical protein